MELEASAEQTKVGDCSGRFQATNSTDTPTRSWCKAGKTFSPPANLSAHQALGVWVFGDGKGEVLNLQQTSPSHLSHAIADHYITVDFQRLAVLRVGGTRGRTACRLFLAVRRHLFDLSRVDSAQQCRNAEPLVQQPSASAIGHLLPEPDPCAAGHADEVAESLDNDRRQDDHLSGRNRDRPVP